MEGGEKREPGCQVWGGVFWEREGRLPWTEPRGSQWGTEGSHGIRENPWALQLQEPRFTVHLWFAGAVQL